MSRCPTTCACRGTGTVDRTATTSRGGAPVSTTTYTTECPTAATRSRWYPGIARDPNVP